MILEALLVGAGGFIGALMRYYIGLAVDIWAGGSAHPAATLLVNVLGSFGIGVFGGFGGVPQISPNARLLLVVGLFGSFTTFSTFALDTLRLRHDFGTAAALSNVALQLIIGLTAVWAGVQFGRLIS